MCSPRVSVCITTYNHGQYIAQTLDSVLIQKTNFEFELIVGEDDSDDDTREVVINYAKQNPGKIHLFLNERKNVIFISGRPTGRWNLVNNLEHAKGEYIALVEGDDYWIDQSKLQKQVDFLDSHPDYSMCFTDARIWDEDRAEFNDKTFSETYAANGTKQTVEFGDMATNHWIPTGSVMYRRSAFEDFPDWFYKIPMADWGLFLSLLKNGPGWFMNECTSVYRVHGSSYWSSLPVTARQEGRCLFFRLVRNEFGFRKGIAMNQAYCQQKFENYRQEKNKLSNLPKLFYKVQKKFWQLLSALIRS